MSYRFIDDIAIADLAFEADGATIDDLFSSAAEALTSAMIDDPNRIGHTETLRFGVASKSLEMLLFLFLNRIILYKDSKKILFGRFDVKISEGRGYKLRCTAYGEKLDAERQKLAVDVKAVTMHMLKVWRENGKWRARVVIDV
ncbi:MAG: archease [Candidatus Micrarchaeaceae archaeon]